MQKQIVVITEQKNSRSREAVSLTLFAQCQDQSSRAPGPIGHTGLVSSSDVFSHETRAKHCSGEHASSDAEYGRRHRRRRRRRRRRRNTARSCQMTRNGGVGNKKFKFHSNERAGKAKSCKSLLERTERVAVCSDSE